MVKRSLKILLFIAGWLFLLDKLYARNNEVDSIRNKFYPESARFQFAGNIGMLSLGTTWSLLKNHLNLTPSLGFAPKKSTGKDIFVSSLKFVYSPNLLLKLNENLDINPLNFGFVVNHTFGENYNKYLNGSKYTWGYYWWIPSHRSGVLYQLEGAFKTNKMKFSRIAAYFEISFWDVYLMSKFINSNFSNISTWDTATLGLGLKFYFSYKRI